MHNTLNYRNKDGYTKRVTLTKYNLLKYSRKPKR